MKTLTLDNGITYEITDQAARNEIEKSNTVFENHLKDFEFRGITLNDVTLNVIFTLPNSPAYRGTLERTIQPEESDNHCKFVSSVKKGDSFVMTNTHTLTSDTPYLIVTDNVKTVTDIVHFDDAQNYIFKEDGEIYICFNYTTAQSGEFFYLKRPSISEPLVLYAEKASSYLADSTFGDEAMNAIMKGRKILVRVPNADGGKYTAIYSPVFMFQMPNYMNSYLYLIYLNDGIDSSSGLPTIAQLKLSLSETYNQTPLS